MKKRLLSVMIAFIAVAMPLLASAQISQEVAGTYSGTLAVSQDGTPMGQPSNENVYLTAEDDNHATLQIKNFKFALGAGVLELGDIVIPGVELQKEGNTTVLLPKDVNLKLNLVGDVTVHLAKSTITDKKLVVKLSVDTTFPVQMTIDVDFEGMQTQGSGIRNTIAEKPVIYYNSAVDALIVNGAQNQKFDIYNVTGMHTMSGILSTNSITISNLSKGIYLIKIGNHTAKFIKK